MLFLRASAIARSESIDHIWLLSSSSSGKICQIEQCRGRYGLIDAIQSCWVWKVRIFEQVSCLFTFSWLFTFCHTCRYGLTDTLQRCWGWKIMTFDHVSCLFSLIWLFTFGKNIGPNFSWENITLARESIGPLPSCYPNRGIYGSTLKSHLSLHPRDSLAKVRPRLRERASEHHERWQDGDGGRRQLSSLSHCTA